MEQLLKEEKYISQKQISRAGKRSNVPSTPTIEVQDKIFKKWYLQKLKINHQRCWLSKMLSSCWMCLRQMLFLPLEVLQYSGIVRQTLYPRRENRSTGKRGSAWGNIESSDQAWTVTIQENKKPTRTHRRRGPWSRCTARTITHAKKRFKIIIIFLLI